MSFDEVDRWEPLQTNLPNTPVYWITAQEQFNDLVIATYGRGFWILDDITPLQQLNQRIRDSAAFLFTPRPAYRFKAPEIPGFPTIDMTTGENPTYGASINYWLKTVPSGDVKLRVLDAAGQVVRTIDGTKRAGLNRVYWDLKHEQSKPIHLRTSPLYAPDVTPGAEGTRTPPEGGRMTLLSQPGTYTIKLSAAGQELTQPLTVRKDPASPGTDADIRTQTAMLRDVQTDLEAAGTMVNTVESIRSQLANLKRTTQESRDAASIRQGAEALEKKLLEIEDKLIQRKFTGQGQDTTRWPTMLVGKID